ncbi:CspA family cold shock protein [Dongia mobilis]|uniref:CspA family cold shock protein n=1 Tax=Dongia mobilis TaxID=578943 RepID=A0A4R6WQY6_9PROT|nr:cold shock domain-containing protein [Dongia mobilis]TDQ78972.1 CspA family cold shock protein [Dongia mobilis]
MSPAAESEPAPVTGTVLWFKPQKGYGFVKPDDGGADVFVHLADLAASGLDSLAEGERISFRRASHGDGRYYAITIGRIGPAD